MTDPPSPPSPPSGPPLGTYFSRRKETHPSPPSPALTWIMASSTNMMLLILGVQTKQVPKSGTPQLGVIVIAAGYTDHLLARTWGWVRVIASGVKGKP